MSVYEGGDGAVQWQSAGKRLGKWRWAAPTPTHAQTLTSTHAEGVNYIRTCQVRMNVPGWLKPSSLWIMYTNKRCRDNPPWTSCSTAGLQVHSTHQADPRFSSLCTIRRQHESESRPVTPESSPHISEGYFVFWECVLCVLCAVLFEVCIFAVNVFWMSLLFYG